eukprot:TRINITY_DN40087_c0_g1_i1.p1 TRINITY_DN40087_c0_g1~~TRINITY_DN40087_c0_g1_i1.p1  ORF type:complete len:601 (+),score=87.14 TRINITY_DN40087_c0_g1_i1:51-1853(+)
MAGVWFRKCLRLHDNAALTQAVADGGAVYPFFILDPNFDFSRIGVNRYSFLLESLRDLDEQLRTSYQSRLLVLRGRPENVFLELFTGKGPFKLQSLYWEKDSEPYACHRDGAVEALASKHSIRTRGFLGHTLLDLDAVVAKPGFTPPISMKAIQKLVDACGPIKDALPVPKVPPMIEVKGFDVPAITEFYKEAPTAVGFPGGEREALKRLRAVCADTGYVCTFEKPKTSSTGRPAKPWEPSTTGLSPYLKFGCLSVREAWHAIAVVIKGRTHSQPPQSLHGQLLFREMFYVLGVSVQNFDKAQNNRMCKDIPWDANKELLEAWTEGRTGFPFIDALMRQLRQTGWLHHLGRHAVACFLTRGDLWQSWTAGRDVFDKYLLDADWAINNGNWLWLAGVAPFSAPYFRVYDPCPGPKSSLNAEQTGEFVKHFVPELKNMPAKYIYKPWTAPVAVQKSANCIVGKDYPSPIVDHSTVREENIARFKAALDMLSNGKAAALPEKFGAQTQDPGAMKSLYSGGSAAIAAGAKGTSKGRGGKGRGFKGSLRGSQTLDAYMAPRQPIDVDSDSPSNEPSGKGKRADTQEPASEGGGTQRKVSRRWGPK